MLILYKDLYVHKMNKTINWTTNVGKNGYKCSVLRLSVNLYLPWMDPDN